MLELWGTPDLCLALMGLGLIGAEITCVAKCSSFPIANLRYHVSMCVFFGVKAFKPCSTALLVPAHPFLFSLQ